MNLLNRHLEHVWACMGTAPIHTHLKKHHNPPNLSNFHIAFSQTCSVVLAIVQHEVTRYPVGVESTFLLMEASTVKSEWRFSSSMALGYFADDMKRSALSPRCSRRRMCLSPSHSHVPMAVYPVNEYKCCMHNSIFSC